MLKENSQRSHELVLNEFDRLTIIAKEETKKAVEYLNSLAKKKRAKNKKDEKTNI